MFFKKFTVVENTPPYWKKENKLLIFILVVVIRTTDKGVLYFPYYLGGGGVLSMNGHIKGIPNCESKKKVQNKFVGRSDFINCVRNNSKTCS